MTKKSALFVSFLASMALALGVHVGPASASEGAPHLSIGAEAVQEASAAIPVQELVDIGTFGDSDRVGWTRICQRGYGDEVWNAQVIDACAGTVHWYYNGEFRKSVNILVLQASMPPRTTIDLDRWCADHSFACAGVFFFAGIAVNIVWGVITG